MSKQKTMEERVCEALNALGVIASYEYPGFISIPAGGGRDWAWGTVNEVWSGDLVNTADGGTVITSKALPQFPSTHDSDGADIALTIREVINAPDVFRFNADKRQEGGTATNGERAANGFDCVHRVFDFEENFRDDGDVETPMVDCLANVFHLCDRDGLDVEDVLRQARNHWIAER